MRTTPDGLAEERSGGFQCGCNILLPCVESELGGVNELRLTAGWRAGDKHSGFAPLQTPSNNLTDTHWNSFFLKNPQQCWSSKVPKKRSLRDFKERPGRDQTMDTGSAFHRCMFSKRDWRFAARTGPRRSLKAKGREGTAEVKRETTLNKAVQSGTRVCREAVPYICNIWVTLSLRLLSRRVGQHFSQTPAPGKTKIMCSVAATSPCVNGDASVRIRCTFSLCVQ